MRKIIVLTPIKNEEWILDTFLKITSEFADYIIIADQNSTDRSVEIASKFPKVKVIINDSNDFNEAHRQKLLINTARELYGMNNILLAIDSDELLNFNALGSKEWGEIKKSKPGTALYFEKPTFLNGTDVVIRYDEHGGWPLGVIDDGAEHSPDYIHSTRIPMNSSSPKLYLKEIKFLHCNLVSLKRQRSKVRYYCLLEAIAKTKSWKHRFRFYNQNYDYAKSEGDGVREANKDWIEGWENRGISIVPKPEEFYWYDLESIKLLEIHGSKRFWFEDVWDVEWNNVSDHFNYKVLNIKTPNKVFLTFRDLIFRGINSLILLKQKIG